MHFIDIISVSETSLPTLLRFARTLRNLDEHTNLRRAGGADTSVAHYDMYFKNSLVPGKTIPPQT